MARNNPTNLENDMNPFKLWSQIKPDSINELKPDFGIRPWDDLTEEDKHIIWKHLEWFFFDKNKKNERNGYRSSSYYEFYGQYASDQKKVQKRIIFSIAQLNKRYKAKNYAPNFLEQVSLDSACFDFANIFMRRQGDVVLELLSLYCRVVLSEREKGKPYQEDEETDEAYRERTKEWRFGELDVFAERLNEVFDDFGIDVVLTRQGFIPKQEEKIVEEVLAPTLKALSDKKWGKVNEHLADAFKAYREKDYSISITNTISAIQAFLQILVNGKVGSGDISKLIQQAIGKSLIPNDSFSQQIFKNIESVFAKERQTKGMAHPRIANPNEINARLILNLAMVFIQHSLQLK